MSYLLEALDIRKNFGGVQAIDSFNIAIEEGGIYGLIGPNGAGKTTIFNTITGIIKPDDGFIKFDGKDITKKRPDQIACMGIGRTFQNIRLFNELSVIENVTIAAHMQAKYSLIAAVSRIGKFYSTERIIKDKAKQLLSIFKLEDKCEEKAGSLPYGHQRKLEICRAIALNPKIILLDEPAAGMNADESAELVQFIKEIKEKFNLTILLIEHHMDVVMNLCEHITVLNFGRVIESGTPGEIAKSKKVIDAYLGEED